MTTATIKRTWRSYRGICGGKHFHESPALETKGLFVTYPDNGHHALSGLDLTVPRGSRTALIGCNGAGKSTLLQVAAGLLQPSAGQLLLFGHSPRTCHHEFAYLPQRSRIDWEFPMSVERLVLTGAYVYCGWFKRPGRVYRKQMVDTLKLLQLEDLAQRQISQLSGGQQQRALIARTILQQADLLLLDEPLNAVDSQTRAIIESALQRLHEEGKTIIMATHHLDRVETAFDQIVRLEAGKIA